MAIACIFSLTQSPELCSDIAESGAADLALKALACGRPDQESEVLLAQLAVVSQMAGERRFCQRLASLDTVNLLMRLVLGNSGEEETPAKQQGRHLLKDCDNHEGKSVCVGTGGGDSGHQDVNTLADDDSSRDARVGDVGGGQQARLLPPKVKRFSGNKVKVASPYASALRYCVVTIAERLGSTLDEVRGGGLTLPPSEMSRMVVSDYRGAILYLYKYPCTQNCDGLFRLVNICAWRHGATARGGNTKCPHSLRCLLVHSIRWHSLKSPSNRRRLTGASSGQQGLMAHTKYDVFMT